MRGIPGMQVVCPADEAELVRRAAGDLSRRRRRRYMRYIRGARRRSPHDAVRARPRRALTRRQRRRRAGYGPAGRRGGRARATALAAEGIGARLVNLRTLSPVDEAAMLRRRAELPRAGDRRGSLLVGGLYSHRRRAAGARPACRRRVVPMALDGRWFRPALLPDVLRVEGFSVAQADGPLQARAARSTAASVRSRRSRRETRGQANGKRKPDAIRSIAASDALYAAGRRR